MADLHPMLALGLELKRREHLGTVASTEFYRGKVEAACLQFHGMRPDWDPTDQQWIAPMRGSAHGMTLVTRDIGDVEDSGVRIVNPWT